MKKIIKKMKKAVAKKPVKKLTQTKSKVIVKKIENSLGITPLNDRVLVKPIVEEFNQTVSGIIIPETVSKDKPEQGEVMAVGEGRWVDGKRVPILVKVGDKIVFSRFGYDDVKINGIEYYILKEENILAVIN